MIRTHYEKCVSFNHNGGAMNSKQKLEEALRDLFRTQYLAVLATQNSGQPYTSLVAFAATDDLKHLLFATGQSTRKYANLKSDARAAMLIDNRSNRADDIAHATAATATGLTEVISGDTADRLRALYLVKHPHLEAFINAPSTAFISLTVDHYSVVSKFQEVTELHIKK